MLIAAALCPWPPLLVRELTGADPVLPELRAACADAVGALLAAEPEAIAVVGPAARTTAWPAGAQPGLRAFGGWPAHSSGLTRTAGAAALPPSIGIGAYLLDLAGYAGTRILWSVSDCEPASGCVRLGTELAAGGRRTALLAMGDGSARRGPKAPGHFDERAAAFDARVERAIRAGDTDGLLDVDPALAVELMATGRPAWQVLAGAARGSTVTSDVQYADDPFGVWYLVASLQIRG